MTSARRLFALALRLRAPSTPTALPALLAFTDPARTPDPAAIIAALPRGAGLVFRSFGSADALAGGRTAAALCRRRGVVFLVGFDAALARALRADGVHLPERALATPSLARRMARSRLPRSWIVTAAAHGARGLARARAAGVDAAVVSPIFPSRSPSAGKPIGPRDLRRMSAKAGVAIYALGGVNARTAQRLPRGALAGIAAVDGAASGGPLRT